MVDKGRYLLFPYQGEVATHEFCEARVGTRKIQGQSVEEAVLKTKKTKEI